jgi:uncharacterized membrane protein YgaE (UPF0421/DUF939 family)
MLKIIGLIGLIGLQGQAYSFDCKYNILRGNTETYAGKIAQSIDSSSEIIKKDLNFLSNNLEKDNITQEYRAETFSQLCQRSLALSPSNKFLKNFVENCEKIYVFEESDTKIRQSVHMLLHDVAESLKEYFDDMELRQSFLNKKKLEQPVSSKDSSAADPLDNQGNKIPETPAIRKSKVYHSPARAY